jgi:uncharacterized protein YerC
MLNQELSSILTKNLPKIFTRKEVYHYLDGFFTPNTLRNIDYLGKRLKVKQIIGRRVLYTRDSFIEWLNNYVNK